MNKILLRTGGAVNLLFVLFHLAMVKPIGDTLAPLSSDVRAAVSTLNIHVAFTLLIFAYFAIFRWRDLLTTRLGQVLAMAISLFWFLRAINQAVFWGPTASAIPLICLCLALGLLYLIPVVREWKHVPSEAQHPPETHADMVFQSQERTGRTPWTGYAAVAWCVVFGGLHLYWALGGAAWFAEFSTPPNKVLALMRDPGYMVITWGVVFICVFGAIIALVPFQAWSRRIPRRILLTPLWIACGLSLVRGIGNPIQSALLIAGGLPFVHLAGADAQAWHQWGMLDAFFFSPWFVLGGLAFGATARYARREG